MLSQSEIFEQLSIGLIEDESEIEDVRKANPHLIVWLTPVSQDWPAAWVWDSRHWDYIGSDYDLVPKYRDDSELPHTSAGHYNGDEFGYFLPKSDLARAACEEAYKMEGYHSFMAHSDEVAEILSKCSPGEDS